MVPCVRESLAWGPPQKSLLHSFELPPPKKGLLVAAVMWGIKAASDAAHPTCRNYAWKYAPEELAYVIAEKQLYSSH